MTTSLAGIAQMGGGGEGWLPPPPEYPDVTEGSGLEATMHTWEPRQGSPDGVLDRLPPASPAIGDANGDGFADVFVPVPGYTNDTLQDQRDTASKLFVNDHSSKNNENFVDVTDVAGIDVDRHAHAAAWTDVNDDSHADLIVGGYGFARLFVNDGDTTFTEQTTAWSVPQDGLVLGVTSGDADRDGDLDLFYSVYTPEDGDNPTGHLDEVPGAQNVLLRNDGTTFTPITDPAGIDTTRRSTGATMVDVNDDGWLDVYVTNYGQANTLWINQQDGTFAEQAAAFGLADEGRSTCQAWTDLDNDGRLDVVVADGEDARTDLYIAQPDGTFTPSNAPGLEATSEHETWGCDTGDFDNDGDSDIVLANSHVEDPQADSTLLLENEVWRFPEEAVPAEKQALQFNATHQTQALGELRATSGIALQEFNIDSGTSVDAVTTDHDLGQARLFRSVGWQGGWGGGNGEFFRVWLSGADGLAPVPGTKVTLESGQLTQTKLVGQGGNWGASSLSDLVFGLAKPERHQYDRFESVSLTVEWGDGTVEHYDGFTMSRAARIVQGQASSGDTFAPAPNLKLVDGSAGDDEWYTSESVTLTLSVKDHLGGGNGNAHSIETFEYSTDGETWTSVDCPEFGRQCPARGTPQPTVTFDGEGTHTLWIRVEDASGSNATTVYPVRLDATPPEADVRDPVRGGVYAQGEQVGNVDVLADNGQSVVLAPIASGVGPADAAHQPVRVDAHDEGGGVETVTYEFARTLPSPSVVTDAERQRGPSFLWQWPASQQPAGQYRFTTTVSDDAGNTIEHTSRVTLAPTTPTGLEATVDERPTPLGVGPDSVLGALGGQR